MPYRKEQFANGESYHIVLRALDNNLLFKDDDDRYRGIFSIYEFNNSASVEIWRRRRDRIVEKKREKLWGFGNPTASAKHANETNKKDKRDRFVDVLAFCLMPNHFHLLLRQLKNNGITNFMRKIGAGYANYFNKKYQRKGYVFQNRFKDVHIETNNQLMTVVNYIHANPISLIETNFKEMGIKNNSAEEVMDFLKNYKWSSYQDYIGIKNFPTVTERGFILKVMGGEEGIKDNIKRWILHKKYLGGFDEVFLE